MKQKTAPSARVRAARRAGEMGLRFVESSATPLGMIRAGRKLIEAATLLYEEAGRRLEVSDKPLSEPVASGASVLSALQLFNCPEIDKLLTVQACVQNLVRHTYEPCTPMCAVGAYHSRALGSAATAALARVSPIDC